jgi:hypothetical protein
MKMQSSDCFKIAELLETQTPPITSQPLVVVQIEYYCLKMFYLPEELENQ